MLFTTKFLRPALLSGGVHDIDWPSMLGALEVHAILLEYQSHCAIEIVLIENKSNIQVILFNILGFNKNIG